MHAPVTAHPSFVDLREFDRGRLDGPAADTIAQHLAECPTCQECIDQMPPDTFVGRLHSPRPASGSTPFPPKTLDLPAAAKTLDLPPELANHAAYRIVGELGRGGMGVVYKAEHKLMGRTVALKVVPPEKLGDDETRDRFLNEIRAAAQLEHDNIVRAYGAEMIGRSFVLEMELVDGHSLDKVLAQKGTLPVATACHLVRQAALGLQHMHERGLVHRDIKPQNLMVTRKGKVKILDVGLARSTSGLDKRLTQSGVFMGTPDYIAPEQIRNTRAADIRADIYSLGCTLYHLLSGRPPFVADDVMGVVAAHLTTDAEPLAALRPEVPAALSAVVARMMARDPAARYQTPGEAAKALLPFCKAVPDATGHEAGVGTAGDSVETASPVSARRGWGRSAARTAVGGGLVASALLLAGIVVYLKWTDSKGQTVEIAVATTDPGKGESPTPGTGFRPPEPKALVPNPAPPKASDKNGKSADALQPGTRWIGEGTRQLTGERNSQRYRVNLEVLDRDGTSFRARFEIEGEGDAHHVRRLTGTIKDGTVSWKAKDVTVLKGHEGHDFEGTIREDTIELSYGGTAFAGGKNVFGSARLKLQAPSVAKDPAPVPEPSPKAVPPVAAPPTANDEVLTI